jgi:hypothetical protein
MEALSFKQAVSNDISAVFLNQDEFADPHTIDGKAMTVLIDDIELVEREKRMKSNMDGIHARQVLIYVSAAEFGPLPAQGRLLKLDGKRYTVLDATEEGGVYAITLEANRSA